MDKAGKQELSDEETKALFYGSICECGHVLAAHNGRFNTLNCRILNCWCNDRHSRFVSRKNKKEER